MSVQFIYDADEVFYGGNPRQKGPGNHIDEDPYTGIKEIVPASYFNVIELAIKELQDVIDSTINLQENIDLALKSITASNIYTYNIESRYNSWRLQSNQSHFDQTVYMNFLRVGVKTNFPVYDGINVAEFRVIEDSRNVDELNAIYISIPYRPGTGTINGMVIASGYDYGLINRSPLRAESTVIFASNEFHFVGSDEIVVDDYVYLNVHGTTNIARTYRYEFTNTSGTIQVQHNFNAYPLVQVVVSDEYINPTAIKVLDANTIEITVTPGLSGTVICVG